MSTDGVTEAGAALAEQSSANDVKQQEEEKEGEKEVKEKTKEEEKEEVKEGEQRKEEAVDEKLPQPVPNDTAQEDAGGVAEEGSKVEGDKESADATGLAESQHWGGEKAEEKTEEKAVDEKLPQPVPNGTAQEDAGGVAEEGSQVEDGKESGGANANATDLGESQQLGDVAGGETHEAAKEAAEAKVKVVSLRTENEELRQKVEVLSEEVSGLKNQQAAGKAGEEAARAEVTRLEHRCEALTTELKRAEAEQSASQETLRSKLAAMEGEVMKSRCELEEANHRAAAVGEQASANESLQRKLVADLKAELQAARAGQEATAGDMKKASLEIEEQRVAEMETQRLMAETAAQMENDIAALSEKVDKRMQDFNWRVWTAAEMMFSSVEAIRDGKDARPKLQAQMQGLVARLRNSEERNGELRAEIVSLQTQLSSYEAEATVLRDHRASTRAELEVWQAEAHRLRQEAFRGQQAMRELYRITASHSGVAVDDTFEPQPEDLAVNEGGEWYGDESQFDDGEYESVSPSAAYWDRGSAPLELAPHLVQQVTRARNEKERAENLWSQPIVPPGANSPTPNRNDSYRQSVNNIRTSSSRRPWSGVSSLQHAITGHRRSRPASAAASLMTRSHQPRRPHSALPTPEHDPDAVCHHATIATSQDIMTADRASRRRASSVHRPTSPRRVWPASAPVSPGTMMTAPRSPLSSPQSASIFRRSPTHGSNHDPRQGFALASAIPHRHPGAGGGQPYYHHPQLAPGSGSRSHSAPQSPNEAACRRKATGGSVTASSTPAARPTSATITRTPSSSKSPAPEAHYTPWSDVNLPNHHEDPNCRCAGCRSGKNKSAYVYEEFANRDPAPFPYLAARSRLP